MANSEAGTSSGNAGGRQYQVFLNFHGKDTRDGFTSFLHRDLKNNGIHAFIDEKGIRLGEKISGALEQAIKDSQIYVPIFSENYAKSKWCLRELKMMVDNVTEQGKKILPIFFYVTPDDVALKTPDDVALKNVTISDVKPGNVAVKSETTSYRKAIENHKAEHEKKQREKLPHEGESWEGESWEEALKNVDKFKGWVLQKGQSQAELASDVVQVVLWELKTREKSLTKDLVGLDDRLTEVLDMLNVHCSGKARLLGIHGMGGIGKTTLARAVYNKLHSRFGKWCAFLDDIRETSENEGLVSLQKKLLTAIDSSDAATSINCVNHGRRRIGEILNKEKFLVVLDDVGEEEQIENLIGQVLIQDQFHLGTTVIITTRNKSVLEFIKQRMVCALEHLAYEMKGMESHHALELFKRHAFHEGSLAKDLDLDLSKNIVSTAGGLPLALKVIGSLLRGKSKPNWEDTLKQLIKIPHKDVQKRLMISYKELNYRQREIFLDIACFFINEDKTNANYMWEACGLYPNVEINILAEMSLINIKDNKFWMHDQLRDLGREIVCQESPTILGRRSRLWTREEVLDLVRTKQRKKKVEAIDLWGSSHISIKNEEIERFESLRFLRLSNGTMHGDFTDCLPMLKWISWHGPLPDVSVPSMHSTNLLVLELFDNHFTDDSKVWDSLKMATKLKSLALVKNHRITRTPDLSKCLALKRLTFDDCGRLTVIDSSIGMLTCLLDLNITHCGLVEHVPDEIGGLEKLERFSLKSKIRQLPNSIGKLTSLRTLDLSREKTEKTTNRWELPKAIGMLDKLEELYLGKRSELVGEIPDEIGNLSSLRDLDLRRTRICRVPETIERLSRLSILDLRWCDEIKELPKLPTSLVFLHVQSRSLEVVPNLSKLTNLIELSLSDGSDLCLDSRSSNLKHMCDLRWIEGLTKLEKLNLNLVEVATLPTNSGSHSLPSSELNDFGLTGSLLSNLENLSKLTLHISRVQEMQLDGLLQLQYLKLGFCDLQSLSIPSSLRTLTVYECPNMTKIQFLGTSASLEELTIEVCMSIGRIVLRGEVGSPEVLNQSECSLRESTYSSLEVFPNALKKLKKLKLTRCKEVPEIQVIGTLFSLQDITIFSCDALVKLSGVSNLKNLQSLKIGGCYELQFVEGLDELEFLSNLDVSCCPSLETLLDRSNSKILERCLIKVHNCGELPNSSSGGPITFKRYKRMAQQGAPQPEKKKRAKMEGDAEEPNTEP